MMLRPGQEGQLAVEEKPFCPGDDRERRNGTSTISRSDRVTEPRRSSLGVGEPLPLGMTETCDGFNFAVFSRHASGVSLELFDGMVTSQLPAFHWIRSAIAQAISGTSPSADPRRERSMAIRVDGPRVPEEGHCFDRRILPIDPHATALIGSAEWEMETPASLSNAGVRVCAARGWIVDDQFGWQDDRRPNHAWSKTVVYETHVRGLTMHLSSGAVHRGRYSGLIEKIPHFRKLGVTTIELMPMQEFRECEIGHRTGTALHNYWGYNPAALFPKGSFASANDVGSALTEIQDRGPRVAQGRNPRMIFQRLRSGRQSATRSFSQRAHRWSLAVPSRSNDKATRSMIQNG